MLLPLTLLLESAGVPPQPPPAAPATGAGRSLRNRRRTFVQIDGEEFEVSSPEHAFELLQRAQQLAEKAAAQKAAEIVNKAIRRARYVGKAEPLTVTPPRIKGSPELEKALKEANERIERVYRAAIRDAEIAMLIAFEEERDDEEFLLLSL